MSLEHPDAIVARNTGAVTVWGCGNGFVGGWENGFGPRGAFNVEYGEDNATVQGMRGRVVPEEEHHSNQQPPPRHHGDRDGGAHLPQRQLDKARRRQLLWERQTPTP